MTVSLMFSCFLLRDFVAVLQVGGRIDDQVFAADQALFDAHALALIGARLDGRRTALPSSSTKTAPSRTADAGTMITGLAGASACVAGFSSDTKRRWRSSPAADSRPDSRPSP